MIIVIRNIFLLYIAFSPTTVGAQDSASVKTTKSYYPNGKVQYITHQGLFNGCGVPISTDSTFSTDGRLQQTVKYSHLVPPNGNCLDIITKQTKTTYYATGVKKTCQHFMADYEGELRPVGTWLWYNTKGRVIRKQSFRSH